MKNADFADKMLEISFEFDRYLLQHPEAEAKVPPNALIIFVIHGEKEFNEYSLRMARLQHKKGQPIVIVKVDKLLPPLKSRLLNPRLEVAAHL